MTLITKGAVDMQNNISDNCCPPTGICKVEALITRANDLTDMVKATLGPMKDIL